MSSTKIPLLTMVYVERPFVPSWFGPFRTTAQCLLWQRSIVEVAISLDREVGFDLVHHVSWTSLHVGSRLWRLKKPFLFGPVGGGQVAPRGFGRYLRGGRTLELMRSIAVRHFTDTLFRARSTVSNATVVLVANYETLEWVKHLGAPRVELMLDLGIHKSLLADPCRKRRTDQGFVRILWTGRLLPRKGVLLALEALAQVDPAVRFSCTILGDGKQGRYIGRWIEQLGLSARVTWKGQVPWADALAAYLDHDIFLFTSLRDTAGSQLMEAMACGNAIITLDHQGARVVVPSDAGIRVPVTVPNETGALIARAIERLAREPETLATMSRFAIEAAAEQTWERKIARATALYPTVVQQQTVRG